MKMRLLFVPLTFVAISALCAADEHPVLGFVKANCLKCHNETELAGDLNLGSLQDAKSFEAQREIWERVIAKLKADEMPPPSVKSRPAATDVSAVTRWLEAEFVRQDRLIQPQAGRVAPRRLNRAEY